MHGSGKVLRGFFYTVGSGYAGRFLSVILTVLLKITLGPEVFDQMVQGVVIYALLSNLHHFGLVQAFLHFQDHADEFVQTHFALNVCVGLAGFVLTVAVAGGMALWDPHRYGWTATVVSILATGRLARDLVLTSESLLRRDFDFRRLSLLHALGTALALSSALVAAWAGWGKWSLLIGGWGTYSIYSLTYVVFFTVGVWRSRPVSIWPLQIDWAWVKRLLRFGAWFWVGWMLQTFVWYYDKLVLGWLGLRDLTYYDHAWWLVQVPTAIITHIILSYTVTLYARYRNDSERMGYFFTRMMGLVVRVSAPLALILIANAKEVMLLFGPAWRPAASIVVWLAGYAFLRPLLDEGFGVLHAQGATRTSARIRACQAAVALVAVPIGAWMWGAKGVAWSMGVVAAVGLAGLYIELDRRIMVEWRTIFGAPLVGLLLMAGAGLWPVQLHEHALVQLALRGTAMMIVYAGTLWVLEREMLREQVRQVRRILASRDG